MCIYYNNVYVMYHNNLQDLFTLTTNTNSLTHDLMKCSCNGYKTSEEISKESHQENNREYQFLIKDKMPNVKNLTINQLLKWEHYQQPIPNKIIQVRIISY